MDVWVITYGHDSTYVSVCLSEESARRETDRLNAAYRLKYGREPYDWEPDDAIN